MKKAAKKTPNDLNLSLVENGLDFIESSLRHIIKKSSQRNMKYAILHLFSGVLLVLKERVRREHWALIFSNPTAANKEKYLKGEFNSVNFDQLIALVKDVCGVQIAEEDEKALIKLRNERNRAEHFEFQANSIALKAFAARTLDFIVDFIHNELKPSSLNTDEETLFEKIKERLPDFEKFVMARESRLKTQLKSHKGPLLRCTSCEYKYVVRDEEDEDLYKCLFCFEKLDDFEALAESYLEEEHGISSYAVTKDGGDWPQHECFDCGQTALVPKDPSHQEYICIGCEVTYSGDDLSTCSSCGVLIRSGSVSCEGCFTHATRD